MLNNLFGAVHMQRNIDDILDDDVRIANRNSLGEQQFESRLQARVSDVRRVDLIG